MTPTLCCLQIDHATVEHVGTYLCCISNVLEERWTEPVDVDIGKSNYCIILHYYNFFFNPSIRPPKIYRKTNFPNSIFSLPVQQLRVNSLFPFCWRYFPIFEREVVSLRILLGRSFRFTTGKWCKRKQVLALTSLFYNSVYCGLVFFLSCLYCCNLQP